MATAGIIVIGNEILSGKVVDSNSPYLCRELRALGVEVERVVVIPDDVDTIAAEVGSMSRSYDFVFSSGGIGPLSWFPKQLRKPNLPSCPNSGGMDPTS